MPVIIFSPFYFFLDHPLSQLYQKTVKSCVGSEIRENFTCVTELSSECKVHLTAAGKALATKSWLSGRGLFCPLLAALARTKVCKMSKATDCNPVDTLSPSASKMDTNVGIRRLSKDAEHSPVLVAITLNMSSISDVRTWSRTIQNLNITQIHHQMIFYTFIDSL